MKAVGTLRSFTLTLFTIMAALLFLMRASPASAAPNCVQDVFGKKLQCTANDVSLSGVVPGSVRDTTGKTMPNCFSGTTFSFIADFQVVTTSTARENIGFYLGTGTGATQGRRTKRDMHGSDCFAATFPRRCRDAYHPRRYN